MKKLALCLSLCTCAAPSATVRFAPYRTPGPFFCFDDQKTGAPKGGIVCLDYAGFMAYMSRQGSDEETPEIPTSQDGNPRTDL